MIAVERLSIRIGDARIVDEVDLNLVAGEVLGLVGESGSGKSSIAGAILGLLPPVATIETGAIHFDGEDILSLSKPARRRLCGAAIAYIPQEPMAALNPTLTIGRQMDLVLAAHLNLSAAARRDRAAEALMQLAIADPARILRSCPFQLSGGQVQRVLIATAFALGAQVLLADEPTTALDASVQADVLGLMRTAATDRGAAVLLITHNIGAVRQVADRIVVLRKGKMIEAGDAGTVLAAPAAKYTRDLLAALPARSAPRTHLPIAVEGAL